MSLYTVYLLLYHRKTCIYLYHIFIYNTHSLYIYILPGPENPHRGLVGDLHMRR